jgi:hypothetical protein
LRNGNIGLAPMSAVTGFLRMEGDGYEAVMARAGELAAQWSLESRPPGLRRVAMWLPAGLRARYALRVTRRIVRQILSTSSASSHVRRGRASLRVKASLFCAVRDRPAAPLCGFYRALVVAVLRAFHVSARATVESCRAVSGTACVIAVELGAQTQADPAAIAA